MKRLKKLVLPLSLVGMLALSSTSVFANNIENISTNEVSENYEIDLYKLTYEQNNQKITTDNKLTSYNYEIELTSDQPKGKVHYYNNSNYPVTLFVPDADVDENEIVIQPYSQGSIRWEKPKYFNKTYTAYVTAHEGYLNGIFSLAKATYDNEFQENRLK